MPELSRGETVKRYRPACTQPCNECPFRRRSLPGWLGLNTPQSFVIEISMERPIPCHTSIDYERNDWLRQWEAQRIGFICAGSLIMMRNMGKLPRDPNFPRAKPDRTLVFERPEEFIAHHENANVRSWETDESYELRKGTRR
jgi:hypothetical protein